MNKKLIIGAAVACATVAAIAAAKNASASRDPKPTMWDKMREGMEQMPEDFPPRVMFDNVEAIRANSERILKLLEERRTPDDDRAIIDELEAVHAP
jgi:Spy/CpxP family protein refolding chaperone